LSQEESYSDKDEFEGIGAPTVISARLRSVVNVREDTDSDEESSDNEIELDDSDVDVISIRRFFDGCGCKRHCEKHFTPSQIYSSILDMREKTKDEKELFVMGVLSNVAEFGEITKRGKKRQRGRTTFSVNGTTVCKSTFQLVYDIKRTVLYSLLQAVSGANPSARVHGNAGRKPHHALTYDDAQRVVTFVLNKAEEIGIPYPAAPRCKDNIPTVYLPSSTTKLQIHALYTALCNEQHVRLVKLSAFKDIWATCVPHIKIAKPREDVCATCERMRRDISAAVTEEEKRGALEAMTTHINDAQKVKCFLYVTDIIISIDKIN